MIIISAGMEKAGTGWVFNMVNDLLVNSDQPGYMDVRLVRENFHLHSLLKHHNCNVGKLNLRKTIRLLVPHFLNTSFVVKTHQGPTWIVKLLLRLKIAKAVYVYRDPRDVVVSMFEHGEKIRAEGRTNSFSSLKSMEEVIAYVRNTLDIYRDWTLTDGVLSIKYEDFREDPFLNLKKIYNFLQLDFTDQKTKYIVDKYNSNGTPQKGLHLNKGVTGRFRSALKASDLELCQKYFGSYPQEMGYSDWANVDDQLV